MSLKLSVRALSRGFSSLIQARSLSHRCQSVVKQSQVCRSYLGLLPRRYYVMTQDALGYSSSQFSVTLHQLVSQGRYSEAISLWEDVKASGLIEDPSIYTVIMSMCEKIGSAEAANAVREDMGRQGLTMDTKCANHYLSALLSDGMRDEAMEFVRNCDTELKENVDFLLESAQCFHLHGHSDDACSLCHMMDSVAPSCPQLLAVELEILGSNKQYDKMWELMDKNYSGDIVSAPLPVQVALVHALALANRHHRALKVLEELSEKTDFASSLTVKSVALLLESAKQAKDYKAGALIHQKFSKLITTIDFQRFLDAPDSYSYLLRAINAALHLQALTLKHYKLSREEAQRLKKFKEVLKTVVSFNDLSLEEELRIRKGIMGKLEAFMAQNFYKILRDNSLVPDRHTSEALLLLSCFSDVAMVMADQVLRLSLGTSGVEYLPSSFTSWTQQCGPLLPHQASRVIELVRLQTHGYQIQLGLKEYEQLLELEYDCGKDQKREALKCIRAIKNMMRTRGVLRSHEGWNLVLRAVSRLGNVGALITTFNDMQVEGIQPTLSTYHLVIDSLLASQNRKSITGIVFPLWRMVVQDYPRVQPDVDLLNKFIRSCKLSQYYERAFYFLTAMQDCNLAPNLETFKELLDTCYCEGSKEKFQTTVNMAKKVLPHQTANIDTIMAKYRQKWETDKDTALVDKLIVRDGQSPSSND